jgi:O-antigen/teichoic acid export membrane protein
MVNKGILQGAQRFYAVSGIGVLEMTVRLILGILLVKIGFAVSGALAAIVIATAVSYFATFISIKPLFKKTASKPNHITFDKKDILNYSLPALISATMLVIALNLDILLIKHYFAPAEAGMYAAISTIAKIILYATSPIVSVMFPMISEKTVNGERHYKLLFFSMAFVIVGSLLVLGLYVIAPAKIIGLLYGAEYVSAYQLLPEIGLAVLFYSLINLLANYYMVIKDFRFLWFFIIDVLALLIAILFFHSSILIVVRLIVLFFGLLFASLMLYYLFSKKEQIKSFLRGDDF